MHELGLWLALHVGEKPKTLLSMPPRALGLWAHRTKRQADGRRDSNSLGFNVDAALDLLPKRLGC